ncbi:MAG: hypothetical protein A3G08_01210 [Candidatus Magasanikbacteria bacterium RIFCSPLOWO2_12_FULL_47_9b]|nr:MAG: hypothetical protein A3G08_01210 [Candidatus Magasanikbacteria bacterium RIFCSPLOWO2_12_FULL_47_9b]
MDRSVKLHNGCRLVELGHRVCEGIVHKKRKKNDKSIAILRPKRGGRQVKVTVRSLEVLRTPKYKNTGAEAGCFYTHIGRRQF